MLNLEYILIGKLPKTERDMLLENLRTERECGRNVLEWDCAKDTFGRGACGKGNFGLGRCEGTKRGTADRDGCAFAI